MTWKPTKDVMEVFALAWLRTDGPVDEQAKAALIAAQPLIAAEERERCKNERMGDWERMTFETAIAQLRIDFAQATAPLKAELEASMAEIARLRGEMAEAEDSVAELTMAIQRFIDGDYPRPVDTKYRDDGKPSKHDQCPHKIWMYEACDACASDFFARSLIPKPLPPDTVTIRDGMPIDEIRHRTVEGT